MPETTPPVDDENDDEHSDKQNKQNPSGSTDPKHARRQGKKGAGDEDDQNKPGDSEPRIDISFNLGGLLGNLAGLSGLADMSGATGNLEQIDENLRTVFERLSKLAEDAEEGFDINQELRDEDGNVRGHFGMSIHPLSSAPGRRPPSSMPGRSPQRPVSRPPGGSSKSSARQAAFEINRQADELVVTVELPGVPYPEIEVALADSTLSVWTTGKRAYHADVRLPSTPADVISETLKDGILEVRLR